MPNMDTLDSFARMNALLKRSQSIVKGLPYATVVLKMVTMKLIGLISYLVNY
ncbi:MAG: hypothetical protein Rpha_0995 [Candidatus Ruthia sp. Apha_13_S6]|nr:hypothetical protein [Candidatus Ruthia sp. Apha_13_S6]